MCIAACYTINNKITITNFAEANSHLPIQYKNSNKISLVTWGRRKNEKSELPLGGWASIISIKKGLWDKYFPKSVKIKINKFLEIDYKGQYHWFDITEGQWVHGFHIQTHNEQRVYVVTLMPELNHTGYLKWPSIRCE